MYTQCPDCSAVFRVTATDLKQAAGKVRCGGCGNAFDALEFLSEKKPKQRTEPATARRLPELKPDRPGGKMPKSISPEESIALLKTLDELAGEDIRIEDTGIEWRVLDDQVISELATTDDDGSGTSPGDAAELESDGPDDEHADEPRYDDDTPMRHRDDKAAASPSKQDAGVAADGEAKQQASDDEPEAPDEDAEVEFDDEDTGDWEEILDEFDDGEAADDAPDDDAREPRDDSDVEELDGTNEDADQDGDVDSDDHEPRDIANDEERDGADDDSDHDDDEGSRDDSEDDDHGTDEDADEDKDVDSEDQEPRDDSDDDEHDRTDEDADQDDEDVDSDDKDPRDDSEDDSTDEDSLPDSNEPPPDDTAAATASESAQADESTGESQGAEHPDDARMPGEEEGRSHRHSDDADDAALDEEPAADGTDEADALADVKEEDVAVESIILEGDTVRSALDDVDDDAGYGNGKISYWTAPEPSPPPARSTSSRVGLGIAAVLLLLALGLQLIHYYRETLATVPAIHQLIAPAYRALGMPLTPDWDVTGWRFEATQGSTSKDDGNLTVYSRIGNTSDKPLPYPLIGVSLTDRFDETVGSRLLEPAEFLTVNANPRKLVRPGESFAAVISIGAPDEAATGYKLDVCYRKAGNAGEGRLRCAIGDFRE